MASKAWKVSTADLRWNNRIVSMAWQRTASDNRISAICDSVTDTENSVSSQVIQPHVPMIKFRKGGINHAGIVNRHKRSFFREKQHPPWQIHNPHCWLAVAGTTAAPSARSGPAQSAGGATGPRVIVLPTIEDIYLPPRYQRRPIDEKEIEYINVSFDSCLTDILTWHYNIYLGRWFLYKQLWYNNICKKSFIWVLNFISSLCY